MLLSALLLLTQFTITLKYDYSSDSTQHNLYFAFFSVSLEYLHNDYTHRFTRSFLLSFCFFKTVRQNVQRKKFSTNDAFVSSRLFSLSLFWLYCPSNYTSYLQNNVQKAPEFTEFFQQFVNCIVGHFFGNRIMPVKTANDEKAEQKVFPFMFRGQFCGAIKNNFIPLRSSPTSSTSEIVLY